MNQENYNMLSAFGLNQEQTRILFSIEYLLTKNDIDSTTKESVRTKKKQWLSTWKELVQKLLSSKNNDSEISLYDYDELIIVVNNERSLSENLTWYHMILLESVAFEAYSSLDTSESSKGDTQKRSKTQKLNYTKQNDYLKNEIVSHISGTDIKTVDRYDKMYTKSLNTAYGKKQKIVNRSLIVIASAAAIALTAGLAAKPIVIALVGSQFVGLNGAALVAASLAALGGGAIAAGGAGMAGGFAVIVGGGALVGAGGGAAIIGVLQIAEKSPDVTISQGAKLSVVLREIILNEQKDIQLAQAILNNYKEQLIDMHTKLARLQLDKTEDKILIQNLKKSIESLERLYHNSNAFKSSFETGLKYEA